MKRLLVLFLSLFILCYCDKPAPVEQEDPVEEVDPDDKDKPDVPDEDDKDDKDDQDDQEDQDDKDDSDDTGGTDDQAKKDPWLIDPGQKKEEHTIISPKYPEMEHSVEYDTFYSNSQDDLDEFGNVDYVVAQGNGTSWPIINNDLALVLYQGTSASKGGSYMRVRAKNGAKLLRVTIRSATATSVAYSVDGKAKKSDTQTLAAGENYVMDATSEGSQICFYCMSTDKNKRLTLNYIKVEYKGGFVAEDFARPDVEYGPLMGFEYPYTEGFEQGFPTTEKPSYYKYGITAGPENLQWTTWYGSFSWQKPITGAQSLQLRVYQEDPEYEGSQLGYGATEFFLHDLKKVSFKYMFSEYWVKATISWCKFGEAIWRNPVQIALSSYSDRQTVQNFEYVLDGGAPCDAKIRIDIDEATGYPSKDHYDLYFDDFVFE